MKSYTVRDARRRAQLTQDQLAERSGLDQTTISDLETGRNVNPTLSTIRALADALHVKPSELRFAEPAAEESQP